LLATIIPSALYAFAVWWLDRYEKEPLRLLLIVFLWGAIPGAIVAVAARFLVVGALAPVITESVKALAIAFIYLRYRKEFNDLLDGVTYGAMTGVGFALTTNLITYVLGFLVGGFDFLRASVLLNGVAFGLSEAFYGAVIGLGFGVAQSSRDKAQAIIAPLIALVVAILLHIANDALRDLAVGGQPALVVIPFLATWGGIVAVIAIVFLSIRKDQQTLQQQLEIERDLRTLTPNEYFYLSTPVRQSQALARALRSGVKEFARTLRLVELARQLAFRRRELNQRHIDPAHDAVVAGLRQRIAAERPARPKRDNR
jgi:RsiW-degrading membrane proteinase PrsW (M82 family)